MKSKTSRKRDGEELTVASSVGDFVDVAGSAAIVDAASGRSGVRARMTVLRAFCIVHHKTTANDQQQPRQDRRGQKGCSRRATLCRGEGISDSTLPRIHEAVRRPIGCKRRESWHSRKLAFSCWDVLTDTLNLHFWLSRVFSGAVNTS